MSWLSSFLASEFPSFSYKYCKRFGGFLLPGAACRCSNVSCSLVGLQGTFNEMMPALLATAAGFVTARNLAAICSPHHSSPTKHAAGEIATARAVAASVPIVRLHTAAACLTAHVSDHIDPEDPLDTEAKRSNPSCHTPDTHAPHPDHLEECRKSRLSRGLSRGCRQSFVNIRLDCGRKDTAGRGGGANQGHLRLE